VKDCPWRHGSIPGSGQGQSVGAATARSWVQLAREGLRPLPAELPFALRGSRASVRRHVGRKEERILVRSIASKGGGFSERQ
jgi:hypothetical protein